MSNDNMIKYFPNLPNKKKLRFLSILLSRLTVFCRQIYIEEINHDLLVKNVRGFNEIYYKIFGQTRLLIEKQPGYSDDVFVKTLTVISEENYLSKDFLAAWEFAQTLVERNQAEP